MVPHPPDSQSDPTRSAEIERLVSLADRLAGRLADMEAAQNVGAPPDWIEADELPECSGTCGEHHWLDRPESDTYECLICGDER